MKLSDVLWDAANKHLAADSLDYEPPYEFSCSAVSCALNGGDPIYQSLMFSHQAVALFLESLGCSTESWGCFQEFVPGQSRQGVRFMWLLIAMHVAEDEGIEL